MGGDHEFKDSELRIHRGDKDKKVHIHDDTNHVKFVMPVDEFKGKYAKLKEEALKSNLGLIFDETGQVELHARVEGSKVKGRKMAADHIRLVLRAFNGECDAAVAKVNYKNITTYEARISKAFETLNKLSAGKQIRISNDYLEFKTTELRIVHEYQEQKQKEKEEPAEATTKECAYCFSTIAIKATRCPNCTSEVA